MRRWLVLIGIVVAVGAVVGRLGWRSWQGRAVSVAAVERGRVVAAVYATGRVDSDQRATVRARVASPLDAVLVGPGQVVASGEVVARQDPVALRLAGERPSKLRFRETRPSRRTTQWRSHNRPGPARDAAPRSLGGGGEKGPQPGRLT